MRKFILAGIGLAMCSSLASAQPSVIVTRDAPPFMLVSYADLNIRSDAGRTRLTHRIQSAARSLCLEGTRSDVETALAQFTCYRTAVNGGLKQIDRAVALRESGAPVAAAVLVIRGQ